MKTIGVFRKTTLVLGVCLLSASLCAVAAPNGAKAIFDSGGGGGTISMSANSASPAAAVVAAAPSEKKYVGISYQILAIDNDGQMRPVSKNRVFRSGERVKILASTNRPGYLTVANIGTSGKMTVLFSEYVEARKMTQIPPNSNLRFDGNPGTENVLIMLSNEPSPFGGSAAGNQSVSAPSMPPPMPTPVAAPMPAYPAPAYPVQASAPYIPPPPMPGTTGQSGAVADLGASPPYYSPLPPDQASASLVASLEGAKSLKAKGSKDLMVDDGMQNSYTVMSPRQGGYKAVSGGAKDLIMESSAEGMNYGLVPVSAVSGGGVLTLEIKLKHR